MDTAAAKTELRARLRAAREARPAREHAAAGKALAAVVLALPEVVAASVVTLYVSTDDEPGTGPLLAALHGRGVEVLLPVLQSDLDLDWATYTGPAELLASAVPPPSLVLLEPTGPRLGKDAVSRADVLLVPAAAVGPDGVRLGQGGGCYDRALGRVAPGVPVVALLFDDELLDAVPSAPHDRPITAAATPTAVTRF